MLPNVALLAICSTINCEASPLLYGLNEFHFQGHYFSFDQVRGFLEWTKYIKDNAGYLKKVGVMLNLPQESFDLAGKTSATEMLQMVSFQCLHPVCRVT